MENLKSKLSPQEVFNNRKSFSHKIHARVLKVNSDISTYLDKFKITNEEDKKLFVNGVNYYYRDLCAVIFHIRQVVIKIDDDERSVRDLQSIISELGRIALTVQESLNLEAEKLKIHLQVTIIDVGSQVQKFIKVIGYDNLQDHKQKILDCQLDLLISAEALKLYFQHYNLNIGELVGLVHEIIEKARNNLYHIKSNHEPMVEDFSHYTRHSVQHLQIKVDYMRKMNNTENYETDVTTAFKSADIFGGAYMHDLLETLNYDNPMNKMLEAIDTCQKNIAKIGMALQSGVQPALLKNIGKKENEDLKQLILYLMVNGINGMVALNLCIEDAIIKK